MVCARRIRVELVCGVLSARTWWREAQAAARRAKALMEGLRSMEAVQSVIASAKRFNLRYTSARFE